jgi:hypothetical protein
MLQKCITISKQTKTTMRAEQKSSSKDYSLPPDRNIVAIFKGGEEKFTN